MPDPNSHGYLGTSLSPEAYYKQHAARYANPHAEGITTLIDRLAPHLHGTVLDLGCGDGLATKHLAHRPDLVFTGADAAPAMVGRYRAETGWPCVVAGFGDALPPANSVIACHALHLATPAEVAVLWWRLAETGADVVAVVTPFKQRPADPAHYFALTETHQGPYGPASKTLYGKLYRRVAP